MTTVDRHLRRDLKILLKFIEVYCRHRHADRDKAVATLKTHDVSDLAGHAVSLCADCTKLLAHAFTKRSTCPLEPRPACKRCPTHCYHPAYRRQIREVMKYSGRRLVMSGRVDYLLHLLS